MAEVGGVAQLHAQQRVAARAAQAGLTPALGTLQLCSVEGGPAPRHALAVGVAAAARPRLALARHHRAAAVGGQAHGVTGIGALDT